MAISKVFLTPFFLSLFFSLQLTQAQDDNMVAQPLAAPGPLFQDIAAPSPLGEPIAAPSPLGQPIAAPSPLVNAAADPSPLGQPIADPSPLGQPIVSPSPLIQPIDCGAACTGRCELSSRPKFCHRACGTCCARCNCVPPGTSDGGGNSLINVVQLGAKPDGATSSSQSFLDAWTAACNSVGLATIYVPPGRYLLNQIVFSGAECRNSNIKIAIEGTLAAPPDYRLHGDEGNWIMFDNVKGVSIHGGTLDGQGGSLWVCKAKAGSKCPDGATSLEFNNSSDILVQGLTSINSQLFHIVFYNCQNVMVQGVNVKASGNSHNTDGIHVQSSRDVTIMGAVIMTGDDCISIGPGTTNLWIEHISCGPGHGISIGSLGKELNEQGVQNVTVKTTTFTGTENGLRIKTWARQSSGFVNGVLFQGATMNNVENPIIIDQNYCPHNEDCPDQVSGVKIRNVMYKEIQGTSASQVAVKFDCSKRMPCSAITLEDVNLTYQNKPAVSSCTSVEGSSYGLVRPSSCLLS